MVFGRARRRPLIRLVAAVVAFCVLIAAIERPAHAKGLTKEELSRLHRGEVVKREITVDLPAGQYTGGVSYVIIQAPAEDVMKALVDSSALKSVLPMVLEARELERRGGDRFVFMRHGGRLGSAAFTVRVRRASPYSVQFWLDLSRPHEIDDMWGSFRVKPIGDKRSLFTYSALLRLPFGFIKLLFEDRIRSIALNTPARVRRYVEGRGATAHPRVNR